MPTKAWQPSHSDSRDLSLRLQYIWVNMHRCPRTLECGNVFCHTLFGRGICPLCLSQKGKYSIFVFSLIFMLGCRLYRRIFISGAKTLTSKSSRMCWGTSLIGGCPDNCHNENSYTPVYYSVIVSEPRERSEKFISTHGNKYCLIEKEGEMTYFICPECNNRWESDFTSFRAFYREENAFPPFESYFESGASGTSSPRELSAEHQPNIGPNPDINSEADISSNSDLSTCSGSGESYPDFDIQWISAGCLSPVMIDNFEVPLYERQGRSFRSG